MADESEEKEHAPSAKKQEDTRKKGTVAKSTEVNSVFVLLTAIFMLRIIGPWILDELQTCVRGYIAMISVTDMSMERLLAISRDSLILLVKIIIPFAGAVMIAGLLANIIQIGWLFTTEPLIPKLEKINPLSGFKRLFSLRSLVETAKSIMKLTVIGYIAYATIRAQYEIFLTLADMSVMAIWSFLLTSIYDIFIRTAIALLAIALLDYAYQRYDHIKKIKMSNQEVKEERKQMDGDPQVKARIRSLQMEMAKRRMMDQVPSASVVVTNPTHLAIAMKYDPQKSDAPVVVAKGKDLAALRIKKIAQENDVPIVEDKPLARAMYDKVEIGEPIPTEFFVAVAEIMAHIYKMKNKSAA